MTIVIAHSKPAAQAACRRILRSEKGIRVVSEASTDVEIIQACTTLKPRIILLHMAPSDSGALIARIRRKSPQTKVIVLADRYSEMGMLKALSLGACGHLITKVLPAFLAKAVRKVDAGEAWVSRKMAARIVDYLMSVPPREETTFARHSEYQVLGR
jgi:DNA-binding NarL/FixJ family response regulator